MPDRSYRQLCAIARALDIVGDRWTLLIIRDLLLGPRRHTDLRHALPGLSPSLLVQRLRDLESDGLVQRRQLPPPAAVVIFELTTSGRALEPVLQALGRWGSQYGAAPGLATDRRFPWLLFALNVFASPRETGGVGDVYEFHVDSEVYSVSVEEGGFNASSAPRDGADVVITSDTVTMYALAGGRLTLAEAEQEGRLQIEGDETAADRAATILTIVGEALSA